MENAEVIAERNKKNRESDSGIHVMIQHAIANGGKEWPSTSASRESVCEAVWVLFTQLWSPERAKLWIHFLPRCAQMARIGFRMMA